MHKYLVGAGALTCFLGVAIGALGAHALDQLLQGKAVGWFDTAVQYQLLHGVGLLFCGLLWPVMGRPAAIAGMLMLVGMCIFCGTLYAMAFGAPRWLGMVTPIGGVLLMVAWLLLSVSAVRNGDT